MWRSLLGIQKKKRVHVHYIFFSNNKMKFCGEKLQGLIKLNEKN